MYEWDEAKRLKNIDKHGVDFTEMESFEWETALIIADGRHSEPRFRAMGMIAGRLHACVYTRREQSIRIISLRKANPREQRSYDNG